MSKKYSHVYVGPFIEFNGGKPVTYLECPKCKETRSHRYCHDCGTETQNVAVSNTDTAAFILGEDFERFDNYGDDYTCIAIPLLDGAIYSPISALTPEVFTLDALNDIEPIEYAYSDILESLDYRKIDYTIKFGLVKY